MRKIQYEPVMQYAEMTVELSIDKSVTELAYRGSILSPTGFGNSKYRSKPAKAKNSIASSFIDLYLNHALCIFKNDSDEGVYVEFKAKKWPCVVYATESRAKISGKSFPKRMPNRDNAMSDIATFGFLAWELVYGSNDELKQCFSDIVQEFTDKKSISSEKVVLFCDSFYVYGMLKNAGKERTIDDELFPASMQMAFNNGALLAANKQNSPFDEAFLISPTLFMYESAKNKEGSGVAGSLIEKCRKGEKIIPYQWSSEQKEFIPSLDMLDDFVELEQFQPILNKLHKRLTDNLSGGEKKKKYINITLSGKPGTGKTTLGYEIGAALGLPVYSFPCSQNTEEDAIEGLTKFVDAKPTSVKTDIVKAFKNGGIVLLEEVNLTPPAVIMGALGQAVEFPYIMKEDGYKTIHRHPLCVFISTMNVGTAGSKTVSEPFANRFRASYELEDPKKNTFIEILMKNDSDKNRTRARRRCTWIYDTYTSIIASIKENNATANIDSILMTLSLRTCIGAIENMEEGNDPIMSMMYSIIGKIAETDMEVAEDCKSILLSRPVPDDIEVENA